jgi:acetyl esterase/lipase
MKQKDSVMRYTLFSILLSFTLAACGGAGGSVKSNTPSSNKLVTIDENTSTGLNNVSYSSVTKLTSRQPDHQIVYGSNPLQYGDLWLPNTTGTAPLLIFIHGGCWSNAYRVDHSYPMASALADRENIAVLSLEYRATGDEGGGWPGSYEDILLALGKISLLSNYGIDTQRVVLAGHSAGGHLALLAASQPEGSQLRAVIGLAAIANFVTYAEGSSGCQQDARAFIGSSFADKPDAYNDANPIGRTMLSEILLFQGGKDTIVEISNPQSTEFAMHVVEEAGHFDWIHPDTNAFAEFVSQLNKYLAND